HPADTGVAGVQIILFIKNPITRFDEMTRSDTHTVTDRADDTSVAIQLQELAVLSACHPWIAVGIEMECADEISHLHGSQELAIGTVDDDSILLPVADPDVTVGGIDCEPMGRVEFTLSDTVAVPLINELTGFIQVNDASYAEI